MSADSKSYLGDGVYCAFDGFSLVLTTENGIETTNTIVLEPEVYVALTRYVARLKQANSGERETPTASEREQHP